MENRGFLAWSTTLWLWLSNGGVLRLGFGRLVSGLLFALWYKIHGLFTRPRCPGANVGVITINDFKIAF
jgi:hypothetical protein